MPPGLGWLQNGSAVLPASARSGATQVCPRPSRPALPRSHPPAARRSRMPVLIGVDPHKHSHTAAVLTHHGQLLDQQRFPASRHGQRALRRWAARWRKRRWALEVPPGRPDPGPAAGRRRQARHRRPRQARRPRARPVTRVTHARRRRRHGIYRPRCACSPASSRNRNAASRRGGTAFLGVSLRATRAARPCGPNQRMH